MEKYYYLIGYRLRNEQREKLKEKGLHVYALRSWDVGCGSQLEHRVIVNHENDVIANFEMLDENDRNAFEPDFYEYCERVNAFENYDLVKDLIKEGILD